MECQLKHRLLVHGRRKHVETIKNLTEANFIDCVHRAMSELRLRSVYPMQSVAWPEIGRGNSMVLINNAASGKTMSFLPAVCSFVQDTQTSAGVGPVAIILCASSSNVLNVARLCRQFVGDENAVEVVEGYGERCINRIVPILLNGCEILVCTVPNLNRLLAVHQKQKMFDKRRIKHLIFDDIDLMVGCFTSELKFVMETFCRDLNDEEVDVQIVVTARQWNHKWIRFFGLGKNPILCFGDFFEAAMYARSKLQLKLVTNAQKIDHAIKILFEQNYMSNRTIIVCNRSEEVLELVRRLKALSIAPAFCEDKSTNDELSAAKSWNLEAPLCQNTVFVCTDEQLPKMDIKLAQIIIHFSLPSTWKQFSFRFSAMSDYFEDLVINNTPSRAASFSVVLLDENDNQQLPRLIDSMLVHDYTDISDEILQFAQEVREDIEDKRRVKLISFCPYILLMGACINIACKYRHILTYSDRSVDSLPRNGRIKIDILVCHSPSHFAVRIVERLLPGAKKWVRVTSDYKDFNADFQNHYADVMNHFAHTPVLKGDICVLSPQGNSDCTYNRCKVLRVSPKSKKITVRLIDEGIALQDISVNGLLQLDAAFIDYPSQAVDLRIANLIPYDYDTKWDRDAMANIKHWLKKNSTNNSYIEGTIVWSSCLNTIWVDTLRLTEKMKTEILVLSIRSNLLDKHFGIENTQCLSLLQDMAASLGIRDDRPSQQAEVIATKSSGVERNVVVPPTVVGKRDSCIPSKLIGYLLLRSSSSSSRPTSSELNSSTSVSDVIGDSNDRWAQLKPNIFQSVCISTFHTPWQFYVQVISPELYKLYESIDEYVSQAGNRRIIHEELTIGMMCLCKAYGKYNRGKVMAIKCVPERGMMITVFFVDLGLRSVLHMHDLLAIPEHLVEKAPFQAILCSLVGIRPTGNASDWHLHLCDRMYERILKPCVKIAIWTVHYRRHHDSNIWAYDCILVDMNANYQTSSLNDKLVLTGLAVYDPVDQYHLTVKRKHDGSARTLDSDDDSHSLDDHQRSKTSDYNFTGDKIEETMRTVVKSPSASVLYYQDMPALHYPAAMPNVKWQQSSSVIILMIEVPTVNDYYLRVTKRSFQFSCVIGDVPQMLHINLLGCIDTEYTSHELCGSLVNVLLIKTLRDAEWPRLMADNDNHKWLKYTTGKISLLEFPKNKPMHRSKHLPCYLDSDDSSDSEYSIDSDNSFDSDDSQNLENQPST